MLAAGSKSEALCCHRNKLSASCLKNIYLQDSYDHSQLAPIWPAHQLFIYFFLLLIKTCLLQHRLSSASQDSSNPGTSTCRFWKLTDFSLLPPGPHTQCFRAAAGPGFDPPTSPFSLSRGLGCAGRFICSWEPKCPGLRVLFSPVHTHFSFFLFSVSNKWSHLTNMPVIFLI